jgi:hypothetical protein
MGHGSRFGGHSLFVKDGRLHYVYNFLGIPPEQELVSGPLAPGRHVLGVEFVKESQGEHRESHGTAKLYIDEDVVAEVPLRTMTGHFSLCGEGLCIGRDGGDAVTSQYKPQFPFTGGTIAKVVFDVGDDVYIDRERHLAAAIARD